MNRSIKLVTVLVIGIIVAGLSFSIMELRIANNSSTPTLKVASDSFAVAYGEQHNLLNSTYQLNYSYNGAKVSYFIFLNLPTYFSGGSEVGVFLDFILVKDTSSSFLPINFKISNFSLYVNGTNLGPTYMGGSVSDNQSVFSMEYSNVIPYTILSGNYTVSYSFSFTPPPIPGIFPTAQSPMGVHKNFTGPESQ